MAITLATVLAFASLAAAAEPLPSWNEGQTKRAIVDFVQRVTTAGGADFVPVPERIAVFDKALDEAGRDGWTVVNMKQDWKRIFP